MKIKIRLFFLFLSISLIPLIIMGVISYENGKDIIKNRVEINNQIIASDVINKINDTLVDIERSVSAWSSMTIMQDIMIKDADGKIAVFLADVSKEYEYFLAISLIDQAGEIISSNKVELIGKKTKDIEKIINIESRKCVVEDVHYDDELNLWVISFLCPVYSNFAGDKKDLSGFFF